MSTGMISMRYARALFEYALAQREEDTVFAEMKKLSGCFRGEQNLRTLLDNPVLQHSEKHSIVKLVVGGTVSDVFDRFISLVLHQKREYQLQSISLDYMELYREHKNIFVGKLVTASRIDTATENKIKQMVLSKIKGTLEFETHVEPELQGGFVLYVDTYRVDASIATQLRNIREQLLDKNKKVV